MHFAAVTQFGQLIAVLGVIIISSLVTTFEFKAIFVRFVVEEQSQHPLLVATKDLISTFNKS
jgi:hypothetical protein